MSDQQAQELTPAERAQIEAALETVRYSSNPQDYFEAVWRAARSDEEGRVEHDQQAQELTPEERGEVLKLCGEYADRPEVVGDVEEVWLAARDFYAARAESLIAAARLPERPDEGTHKHEWREAETKIRFNPPWEACPCGAWRKGPNAPIMEEPASRPADEGITEARHFPLATLRDCACGFGGAGADDLLIHLRAYAPLAARAPVQVERPDKGRVWKVVELEDGTIQSLPADGSPPPAHRRLIDVVEDTTWFHGRPARLPEQPDEGGE